MGVGDHIVEEKVVPPDVPGSPGGSEQLPPGKSS
jgi:hypothetical protein